jgi:hypothetical protein
MMAAVPKLHVECEKLKADGDSFRMKPDTSPLT